MHRTDKQTLGSVYKSLGCDMWHPARPNFCYNHTENDHNKKERL